MTLQPIFVPGGVYLRTSTGELIGQLDKPGAPFATLTEARDHADWLDMVMQFQQTRRAVGLVGASQTVAVGDENSGTTRSASCREKQLVPQESKMGK